MNQKYNYCALGGLVNTNTLSPNANYHYKMLKPQTLGMATFWTRLAFYNIHNELIYFNAEYITIAQNFATLEFAIWSKQGNVVFFTELDKAKKNAEIVILNFNENIAYRINGSDNEKYKLFESLELVDRLFDEMKLLTVLIDNQVTGSTFTANTIPGRNLLDYLFLRKRWFPKT